MKKDFKRFWKDACLFVAGAIGVAISACVILAICIAMLAWQLMQRRWFWVGGLIGFGLVLLAILFSTCVIFGYSSGRTFDSPNDIPDKRVAVVMGCIPKLADGSDNLYFVARIKAAADLYKAGKADYFIVSGDNHKMSYNEPQAMKLALIKAGVPAKNITYDFAGFRTLDSVVRAKEVFSQDKIIIVSQPFHNRRAIFLARQHGIEAIAYNAQDYARSKRVMLREMLAWVKTLLDTWLLDTEPKFYGPKVDIHPAKK